jgi:hypothetical protein
MLDFSRPWPALQQLGYRQRCEAILEAIDWMTNGQDLPSDVELVFLASLENWAAAHGDVDALASAWALRKLISAQIASPAVLGSPLQPKEKRPQTG